MITTGKAIYTVLSTNAPVVALVGSKIYPLVIPEGTTLPCIVYERSFSNPISKDGLATSDSTVNITILATDYKKTISIAEAVNTALTGYKDTHIKRLALVNGAETYLEGAFVQNLTYAIHSV